MPPAELGVHLVGSICGADTANEAFRKASTAFANRLRRIPDGEPGHRGGFIGFQREVFRPYTPEAIRDWSIMTPGPPVPASQLAETLAKLPHPLETGYDTAALESYAEFKKLREEGVIESVVPDRPRFQVCLPTAAGVMPLIADGYKAAIEPVYERALLRALRNIQEGIPHADLAVQIDVASEIATLEGVYYPHCAPYYSEPLMAHIVERVRVLAEAVAPDVEVGLHLCYGDLGHEHFVQPRDTGLLAELAAEILQKIRRQVNWVHLPVPKERDDETYFAPLRKLDLGDTELYLGLVHANDADGTERRLKTAEKVLGNRVFGVGTECGMGRTPSEEFGSIVQLSVQASTALR